jgi:hypothetical protein
MRVKQNRLKHNNSRSKMAEETTLDPLVETEVPQRPSILEPSRLTTGEYAILMETNDSESESWLFFIRVDGNQEALQHLQNQLEKVDWELLEDLSTFDLDLDHYVSATTAKQMTRVDLNAHSFHRKFDGKLEIINLGFGSKDKNKTKICKAFDLLGYGQIEDFIGDEDLDDDDLDENSDESVSDASSVSESSSDESDEKPIPRKVHKLPPSVSGTGLPDWVKNKKNQHRHH